MKCDVAWIQIYDAKHIQKDLRGRQEIPGYITS